MVRRFVAGLCVIGGLCAVGCSQTLRGSLTTTDVLSVRATSGVTLLPPGTYRLALRVSGDRVRLQLKGQGKQADVALRRPTQTPREDRIELLSADSGQPFDFRGQIDTISIVGPSSTSVRPCPGPPLSVLLDPAASQMLPRGTEYSRTTTQHLLEVVTLTASLHEPATGRVLAHLSARHSDEAAQSSDSGCRYGD